MSLGKKSKKVLVIGLDCAPPELVFEQVRIINKVTQKPAIYIQQIKLNFSLWRSLLSWQPMLEKLRISGVHLTVLGFNILC